MRITFAVLAFVLSLQSSICRTSSKCSGVTFNTSNGGVGTTTYECCGPTSSKISFWENGTVRIVHNDFHSRNITVINEDGLCKMYSVAQTDQNCGIILVSCYGDNITRYERKIVESCEDVLNQTHYCNNSVSTTISGTNTTILPSTTRIMATETNTPQGPHQTTWISNAPYNSSDSPFEAGPLVGGIAATLILLTLGSIGVVVILCTCCGCNGKQRNYPVPPQDEPPAVAQNIPEIPIMNGLPTVTQTDCEQETEMFTDRLQEYSGPPLSRLRNQPRLSSSRGLNNTTEMNHFASQEISANAALVPVPYTAVMENELETDLEVQDAKARSPSLPRSEYIAVTLETRDHLETGNSITTNSRSPSLPRSECVAVTLEARDHLETGHSVTTNYRIVALEPSKLGTQQHQTLRRSSVCFITLDKIYTRQTSI